MDCRGQITLPDAVDTTVRSVVAVVLHHEGEVCLLRRSQLVSFDRGLWHCITGYLDEAVDAEVQARREVLEETGLDHSELTLEDRPRPLQLVGEDGSTWKVLTFLFRTTTKRLSLNWENDDVRWVRPKLLDDLQVVPWLPQVLSAVAISDDRRS